MVGVKEIIEYGAVLGFFVLAISLLYRYFDAMIRVHARKISKGDLRKSDFFNRMDEMLLYKVPMIRMKCRGREKIFKDMLRVKLKFWKDGAYEMIDAIPKMKDSEDFIKLNKDIMLKVVESYEAEWIKMGIPEKAIENFRYWHEAKIHQVKNAILTIGYSSIIDSYEEKTAEIMYIYSSLLGVTVADVEKVLKDANGELSGKKYKNIKLK